MLARTHRLHKNRDVQRVLHKGTRMLASHVRLSYQVSRRSVPRFTVVISAKTLKKATERNRLKRQLRAALRRFVSEHIDLPIDGVFIVTKPEANVVIDQALQFLEGLTKHSS